MSERNMEQNRDMDADLVEACAVKSTMHEQFAEVDRRITALVTQIREAQVTLEKLTAESSSTEANLQA